MDPDEELRHSPKNPHLHHVGHHPAAHAHHQPWSGVQHLDPHRQVHLPHIHRGRELSADKPNGHPVNPWNNLELSHGHPQDDGRRHPHPHRRGGLSRQV